ncbi:hypothetical protein Hanom_Chr01g00050731 [Helianthus anomalus]
MWTGEGCSFNYFSHSGSSKENSGVNDMECNMHVFTIFGFELLRFIQRTCARAEGNARWDREYIEERD